MAAAGRALAGLHRVHGERFGLERDNFIGAVPQDNRAASDTTFATFFRERRVAPLAVHLPPDLRKRLEAMRWVLTESACVDPRRPVERQPHHQCRAGLHRPGHVLRTPEQDLAMTHLFGGFGDVFYDAYREASGWVFDRELRNRIAQLTLYPLLVHVALLGATTSTTYDV